MLRYSLSKLGRSKGRRKGTRAELPTIEGRLSTEREYYAAMRRILTELAKETRESIIPAYQAERRQTRAMASLRLDADQSWFNRMKALAVQLVRVATGTVNTILDLEAIRHTDTFMAQAKRALGIDIGAVVRQEDLEDHLRLAVSRNAALIKSLAEDTVKRIEMTVYENSVAGNSVATLRQKLKEDFGISDRRAQLIARTESSKFNAELNMIRQKQAGITEYIYSTSKDERVRPLHAGYDGKTFKWDVPPSDGHPGTAPNCRCVSRGIVVF